MALKDWKKTGRNKWVKSGRKRNIRGIEVSLDRILFIEENTGQSYNVLLGKKDTGEVTMLRHPFKTKSKALKFAKSYMRNH